jgi:SAM-dependent methyltransferase
VAESLPGRENFALRTSESWQPPPFRPPRTVFDRALAAARRLLDLQAASAWRDLRPLLASARGDVLDVGSGAQPYRPLLPKETRYRAIDVALAREAFGYEMPDTEYYEGERWPVPDAAVDVVLATETLEHVPEPAGFLAEARRVLRPGGRIVLTVPFAARWHYIPHDYWRFTPSSLRDLLEAAGFAGVVVHARGNELTVACYKLMALVLPALFPPGGGFGARRLLALLCLPLLVSVAFVAQLSLRRDGGADCLGWTVSADVA